MVKVSNCCNSSPSFPGDPEVISPLFCGAVTSKPSTGKQARWDSAPELCHKRWRCRSHPPALLGRAARAAQGESRLNKSGPTCTKANPRLRGIRHIPPDTQALVRGNANLGCTNSLILAKCFENEKEQLYAKYHSWK